MHSATLKFGYTFLALFSILILGMPSVTGTLHAQATGGISGGGTTTTTPPPPAPDPPPPDPPPPLPPCTQTPVWLTCSGGTVCSGVDANGCNKFGMDGQSCYTADCWGNSNSWTTTCSANCGPQPAPDPPPPDPPIVLVNGVNQFSGFFIVPATGTGRKATVTIKVSSTTATPINFNDPGTPTIPPSGALIIAQGQSFSGQYLDTSTGSNTSNIAGLAALNRSGISFVMKQTLATVQNAPPGNPNAKADDPADGPDVALYSLNGNGQTNYSFDVTVFQDTKFSILAFAQLDGSGTPMKPPTDITMTMTPISLITIPLVPTGTIKIPPSSTGSYQPGAIVPIDWSINYN
jgi:hypothetical protein